MQDSPDDSREVKSENGMNAPQGAERPALYLHIGAHRTATTSIQRFMHHNRDPLIARGYLYPFGVARHFDIANRVLSHDLPAPDLASDLHERMLKNGTNRVVLSDEDICMRPDISAFAGLAEVFDVRIVFTLRRQDLWLESWWSQNIKGQWNPDLAHKDFASFIRDRAQFHWIAYDNYITRLEKTFGRENIILNVFERSEMPDGPAAAFCKAIGITDLTGFEAVQDVNNSLTPLVTEIMRHLPLDQALPAHRGELVRACGAADRAVRPTKPAKLLLPHDQRLAIMAEYEPGNAAIAERYFGRKNLFRDPLPKPEAPVADMNLPPTGEALLEQFILPFMQELISIEKARLG